MKRTRVKICGITRLADAKRAVQYGADALGFVFVPASARYIEPRKAREIVSQLPPFVSCVGLFLDAGRKEIDAALAAVPEIVPQFHGRETADECESHGRAYLKAIGVANGMPSRAELDRFERATGFLLDSNVPGELGGTGHVFDWQQLGMELGKPLVLAGGLNADNVGVAVRKIAPYALDVSSGVESAKGIKDADAIRAFMAAVAAADIQAAGSTQTTGSTE